MSGFVISKGIHLVYTKIGHRERRYNSILIVGYDQMTVGYDKMTVGHDQTTLLHNSNCWSRPNKCQS